MSVFDEIRDATAAVMKSARHVRIRTEAIEALARELEPELRAPASWDTVHHFSGDPASTLAFVITLDAVNFGSGWFPELRKRDPASGYYTVAGCLKDRFERHGPWTAVELSELEAADCNRIFGQQAPGLRPQVDELMALFAQALRDLGDHLRSRFGGRFEELVGAAEGRGATLVGLLAEMPLYRDVAHLDGRRIPFYKRAQITVMDLSLAFEGRHPGAFEDLDGLTVFADNLVPHVLRHAGVLEYDTDLERQIDEGMRFVAGSRREVELRAAAIYAGELLVADIEGRGGEASARRIDQALWTRGQRPDIKARPRHRCRTSFY